ncbi:MAG: nucleotide pyrophosphohydrolase [Clostridiales bacterium]|nr:nucleotide pyrophosphohydrolase [Clostridiales bacterium]
MEDLRLSELLDMQRALWERNAGHWDPLAPEFARNSVLFMLGELGEAIAIIKKRGEDAIMRDPALRRHFVEELVDMWMYAVDVLLRYDVTAEEFSEIYLAKHARNMRRDFPTEHASYLKEY